MVAFLLLYFLLCRISTISPISTSSFSSCAMKRVVLLIKWCFANFKLRIQYGTSTVGVRLISFTPRVTYRSWQSSYCSEKRIFLSKMDQPCAFSSPNSGRRVNFAHQFFVITQYLPRRVVWIRPSIHIFIVALLARQKSVRRRSFLLSFQHFWSVEFWIFNVLCCLHNRVVGRRRRRMQISFEDKIAIGSE